jgi:hypothetical protein
LLSPASAAACSRLTRLLRNSNEERERGTFANASNAQHQVKANREVVVSAQLPDNATVSRRAFSRAMSLRTARRNSESLMCSSRTLKRGRA